MLKMISGTKISKIILLSPLFIIGAIFLIIGVGLFKIGEIMLKKIGAL